MTAGLDAALVVDRYSLGSQWPTIDPFLFVAHHRDAYPAGNDRLGPASSIEGRQLGMDFAQIDGWNMYHGNVVPGFPQHPHRGFETVTHVRRGLIDHADSLGATARFGPGDTQWLTAGKGIVHAEMFPLLDRDGPNPLELFQIWLNLPRADKLVEPYFTMLWSESTPRLPLGPEGESGEITVIAGALLPSANANATANANANGNGDEAVPAVAPLPPPPSSWAARDEAEVAIWHLQLGSGASAVLPPTRQPETRRVLYVYDGSSLSLAAGPATAEVPVGTGAEVATSEPVEVSAGGGAVECLVLQGRPIGEPVAHYGPFVMNDRAGIAQTIDDYQRTGFGGWPWPSDAPVHDRSAGRFAVHADGRQERRD
jgi:redox-sensitive bicupin YhaK (pirin superfamily)